MPKFDSIVEDARTWADDVAERKVTLDLAADGQSGDVALKSRIEPLPQGYIADREAVALMESRVAGVASRARQAAGATRAIWTWPAQDLIIEIVRGLEKHQWDAAGTEMTGDRGPAQSLRATGLKATRPRLLVLEALREAGPHLSTDELVEALDARGTPPAAWLCLQRGGGPGGPRPTDGDRYRPRACALRTRREVASPLPVCRTCGLIEDVECVVGLKPCLEPDRVNGEVDEAQVIFRGTCTECPGRVRQRENTYKFAPVHVAAQAWTPAPGPPGRPTGRPLP